MKWVLVSALVACKQKDVPSNPPPNDDAATVAIDAEVPIDNFGMVKTGEFGMVPFRR